MEHIDYTKNTTHKVSISISKEDREKLNGTMWEHQALIVIDRIRKEICEVYDRMEYEKDKDFYDLMSPRYIAQCKNQSNK